MQGRRVGEDVALGEGSRLGVPVAQARDAVVEQSPARGEQAGEARGVGVDLVVADVLDHADRGDGIERSRELAPVHHLHVYAIGETRRLDVLARELSLGRGQRHGLDEDTVATRRVDRERAPATADVEDMLALAQSELLAHELELGLLRLLERARPAREDRAAVGHRAIEEEGEEFVGDVVVVAHRARVALAAAIAALGALAIASTGLPIQVAYVLRDLPLQAAAQVAYPEQFSLAYALSYAGLPARAALAAGALSTLVLLVLSVGLAWRLRERNAAFAVYLPAAGANRQTPVVVKFIGYGGGRRAAPDPGRASRLRYMPTSNAGSVTSGTRRSGR